MQRAAWPRRRVRCSLSFRWPLHGAYLETAGSAPLNTETFASGPGATWWHLAVVNDGDTTVMYVEGCPTVDSPSIRAAGLTQLNLPWVLGGYEYGG